MKKFSPTGNRTPASRVTGGDTDHYTIEDLYKLKNFILVQINLLKEVTTF